MQPNSFKRLQMSSSKYFYHGLLVVCTQGPIEVCPSPSFLCACMHTYAMQQSPTSPDIKMHAYHSHDEDQYRCVCFSIPILHVHIHYMTELAPTCRQLLAFLIPYTSMPCINNIPLSPLTLQVFPSLPQHNSN